MSFVYPGDIRACRAGLAFTVLPGSGSEAFEVLGEHIKLQVDEFANFTVAKGGHRVGVRCDPAGEAVPLIVELCGSQADTVDCY